MNTRGFQIAASTLVVMILGLIIVSGGMYFIAQISGESDRIAAELTGQQQEQLRSILTSGQLVAVYPTYGEVDAGKDVTFGLGVENRLENEREFAVLLNVLDEEGNSADTSNWMFLYTESFSLERGERQEVPIVFRPAEDTPPQEYTMIVTVTYDSGEVYDTPRFFSVRVR